MLKSDYIQKYERMGVRMYVRAMETRIFNRDVRKYVRVTTIMIFDKVYVTNHSFIKTERIGVGY